MTNHRAPWMLLTLAFLIWPLAAPAQQPKPMLQIEYGYPEQPPFAYTDEHGQAAGHYVRFLKEMFKRAGMPWRATAYPAPRLMYNLEQGDAVNFSVLVYNPKLDACCIWGQLPVWYDELKVYHIGDKAPIRRKGELNGKEIITLSGFAYGGLITYINDPANHIRTQPAGSHEAAFEMLEAGRADYLLNYASPSEYQVLSKRKIANLKSETIEVVNRYFVISKSYPDAARMLERLEAIYRAMRNEDVRREYTR